MSCIDRSLSTVTVFARYQQRIQFAHCFLLHAWQHMGIDIHRHANLGVTQHLLDHLGMDTETEEQCCSTMPQVG